MQVTLVLLPPSNHTLILLFLVALGKPPVPTRALFSLLYNICTLAPDFKSVLYVPGTSKPANMLMFYAPSQQERTVNSCNNCVYNVRYNKIYNAPWQIQRKNSPHTLRTWFGRYSTSKLWPIRHWGGEAPSVPS